MEGRHNPENFGFVAKRGQTILNASLRGGNFRLDLNFFKMCKNNFKTVYICTLDFSNLGGTKEFGRVAKGGRKILDASPRRDEKF